MSNAIIANHAADAPPPIWVADFCRHYAELGFNLAWWFLYASLALAALAALIGLIGSLRRPPAMTESVDGGAESAGVAFVGALKGLIEALTAAPIWLAMFACGALMFWLAGLRPELCSPPAPPPPPPYLSPDAGPPAPQPAPSPSPPIAAPPAKGG